MAVLTDNDPRIIEAHLQEKHNSKNYRFQIIAIVIAIILIAGGLGGYYRNHLFWKYIEWRYELKNVEKIPCRIMPETAIPEGWIEHSWGCMNFFLPSDASIIEKINNTIAFSYGDTNIIITLSPVIPEISQFSCLVLPVVPTKTAHLTLPKLRLESHRVGTNDFHWSMSPGDVQRYSFAMCMRSVLNVGDPKLMESISKKDWEGVLMISEHRVFLDWQCISDTNGGHIHFLTKNQEPDLKIIRGICQSITINSSPHPLIGCPPENEGSEAENGKK